MESAPMRRSPPSPRSRTSRAPSLPAPNEAKSLASALSRTSRPATDAVSLPSTHPLHHDETATPNASSRALQTAASIGRGVNFGNMLEAPTEGPWGLTVTDDFIDKASAAGFASVRLPVRWNSHASAEAPFTIDPAFMQRVESVVDKLLAKGLVVVVNMHSYRQFDGDPLDPGELAVARAAVDVRFVMLWDQIARRFQGHNARVVFELYNEPHGRISGEPWNVLAARALGVARKTNAAPDRLELRERSPDAEAA